MQGWNPQKPTKLDWNDTTTQRSLQDELVNAGKATVAQYKPTLLIQCLPAQFSFKYFLPPCGDVPICDVCTMLMSVPYSQKS